MSRLLCLVVALLAAAPASAQIYKWTDEQGRVHYGEKPPAGAKPSTVKPPSPAVKPAPAENFVDREVDFRRRQIEKRDQEEAEARQVAERRKDCDDATDELEAAKHMRLYRREKGEKVVLTDTEQKAYIAKLHRYLEKNCSGLAATRGGSSATPPDRAR